QAVGRGAGAVAGDEPATQSQAKRGSVRPKRSTEPLAVGAQRGRAGLARALALEAASPRRRLEATLQATRETAIELSRRRARERERGRLPWPGVRQIGRA